MRAALGLPLSRLLFGVADNLVTAELRDQVTQQLNSYEPGINVLSVVPITKHSKDGQAEIKVNYQPVLQGSSAKAISDTVVIEVGGTVKEVTLNGNG
jgi:phage baseplate assembly protein W